MALVEEYIIPPGSDQERMLKSQLSQWSNGIPFHAHTDFGDKIRISKATYSPVYTLQVLTQFYSQYDQQKERPYGNGPLYGSGPYSSPKKYERDSFVKHTEVYCLPGTETVHTCRPCNGQGKITCHGCGGNGQVNCNGCNGGGKCSQCHGAGRNRCYSCNATGRMSCSGCGGQGGRNEYDSNSNSWVFRTCHSCGGSRTQACHSCSGGYKTCMGCGGSGNCRTCQGRGRITCSTCQGHGKLTCPTCKGYGKMIAYTERVENWDYGNLYEHSLSPSVQSGFSASPVPKKATSDFLFDKSGTRLESNLFNAEPRHFQSAYQGLLTKSTTPTGLTVRGNANILEQYVRVNRIPAYHIHYEYEGDSFGLIVFSKDKAVHEEDGPITRARTSLIESAESAMGRKNYGKAAEYSDQAVKMGLSTTDPRLEKIAKKVTLKIKASYKIGAFAGAWLTSWLAGLWILSFFRTPAYALGFLNETTQTWGNDFILTNNGILIILLLVVSSKQCLRLAADTMVPFPGREMKPEAMRMATGFISGALYTAFIAVTLVLLNITGLLIPVMWLLYRIIETFLPLIPAGLFKQLFA